MSTHPLGTPSKNIVVGGQFLNHKCHVSRRLRTRNFDNTILVTQVLSEITKSLCYLPYLATNDKTNNTMQIGRVHVTTFDQTCLVTL